MARETEWQGCYRRRIEARFKRLRFPWVKTLEQLDFDFQPSFDRRQVGKVAGLSLVERVPNVVILGRLGVGKTHLAVALDVKAVEAGYSVLFLMLKTLMTCLMLAKHENHLERALQLVYPRLLVLDEIGYTSLSREEAGFFLRHIVRDYDVDNS